MIAQVEYNGVTYITISRVEYHSQFTDMGSERITPKVTQHPSGRRGRIHTQPCRSPGLGRATTLLDATAAGQPRVAAEHWKGGQRDSGYTVKVNHVPDFKGLVTTTTTKKPDVSLTALKKQISE